MHLPSRLAHLYLHLKQSLLAAGIDTAERDARLIIRQHTNLDWADLVASPEEKIGHEALKKIEFDFERRLSGMPISRMYGERAFWGLDFKLNTDTLDPRPDTETLVEVAVDRLAANPPKTILDLGTGTGCILTALLSEWKEARGVGVDRSFGAVALARENAQANGVGERAMFFCGSWAKAINARFDLIVSNPPYISNREIAYLPSEVKNHDPILALDGGEDGYEAYRSIFMKIKELMAPGASGLFEIGYGQEDEVARLAENAGLVVNDVHPDLAGIPRVVEISCGDK